MKVPTKSALIFATWLGASLLSAPVFLTDALGQVRTNQRAEFPNLDKRVRTEPGAAELAQRDGAKAQLKAQLPSAEVSFDALLGTPTFVHSRGGLLTGPNGEGGTVSAQTARAFGANDPHRPVKAFLSEHSALFGHGAEVLESATIGRETVGAQNNLRTVVWQQQLDGIPVFEAILIGNITKRGELATLASRFLPNVSAMADAGTPNRATLQANPSISVEQAIVNSAQNVGDTITLNNVASGGTTEFGAGYRRFQTLQRRVHARLVWLPMNRGALRLCWEVFLSKQASLESFQVLIDAETGEVLVRRGLTRDITDATYNVYTSDSPSPFSPGWPTPNTAQPPLTNRVLVTLSALDTTASPNGWINDGDNETRGNNTDTFLDRNFDQQPDGPRPQGNPTRVFDFPLDLTQAPDTYTDAATVQMFYWINYYHDRLYQLGFTESAGNYQVDNFGRGGLGNDEILSYVQAGATVGLANNAFFAPAPDGINGQIAMFVWDFSTPDRDGDLDADVILHEATHGTSQRLVGGGVLISALQTDGMGEGWSDFYSLSLSTQAGDDPDAVYAWAAYSPYQLFGLNQNYYFGIRRYPYTTDMAKNPFTFKDIDPTQASSHPGVPISPLAAVFSPDPSEVHNQGEIWCVTLWDARANLVRKYGYAGNQMMLQLVTDGMKLGPANPTFLQARDAIILADLVNNGGANSGELWAAFAKRGMGFSATAPDSSTTTGVVEAYDVPGLSVVNVNVFGGNGNGIIDVNECNSLQVILANFNLTPATHVNLTLSTTTPGVALGTRKSDYADIPPRGLGTNVVPFTISTAPFFVCGTPITLQALLKSDQATTTNTIVLNTGTVGVPVRFNSTAPAPIPDNNPTGTNSPITVSNITSAIREVSVSLFLTHTFDSDLRLELISPDGTTVVLSDSHGGSGDNYGGSCAPESARTTFDDNALIPIGSANPPFLGSYRPDQQLARFVGKYGTNVNGIWKLHAVDKVGQDVGTIQCWSLFVSPAQCTDGGGTCPGADLALGLKDAPDPVFLGSNLVYTITVTNNGPSEAKNTVVNQLLPASVVPVSAVPSQGSAGFAGGTMIGNLGTIPYTAVATITVTVTPAVAGVISSSASVTSSDADPDTSNNSATATTHVNPPSADLAVGILDTPDPAVVGGSLTYTISVTNKGPSNASGVMLTNTLSPSLIVNSAVPSQGSATINGNVVFCNFGTLVNGAKATVVIQTTPTAQGTVTATATATALQADSVTANNTATATTTVGPAANLSVTLVDTPDPVVVRSNWTYFIVVNNSGPSTATGVVINQSLPANVSVVTNTTTQGNVAINGSTVTGNLGTLLAGGSATVTVVVNATNSGVYSSSVSVIAAQTDPNNADNSASATTTVSPPNVSIVAAGATLSFESISPPNGALDVGETVTLQLRLRNAGNVSNTNLLATLLATGGVTSPSPATPVSYGVLPPSGSPVGNNFTFTVNGTNGGTVTVTLQLQDGGNGLAPVTFTFALPTVRTFANTNYISITDNQPLPWPAGPASPYPSTNFVSGVTGLVGKVSVTLSNFSHSYPDDVDILLVGPGGQKVILMSDAGGSDLVTNVNVTLDDSAPTALPDGGQISSATYRPADYEPGDAFNAPAPAGPYTTNLSAFTGINVNGTWSLYIMDDTTGDPGSVGRGWSLAFSLVSPVNQVADLRLSAIGSPNPVLAGDNLTCTFTVTNGGPNTATAVAFTNIVPGNALLVSAVASQGSVITNGNTAIANLGNLNMGAVATITVVVKPTAAGPLTNTGQVGSGENDLNPANNAASVVVTVNSPVADVGIVKTISSSVGSTLTFSFVVANSGPQSALNVMVTDPLPAGLTFMSSSAASVINSGGTITVSLGDLAAGTSAAFTITASDSGGSPRTNVATVSTGSSDSNGANNSAAAAIQPQIVPAGAVMLTENSFQNGAIDAGETVTLSLALQNVGATDPANLGATLQASGGVTPVTVSQNYGALVHGGAAVARSFTFTANGPNGGVVVLTLQLQDGASSLGNAVFAFHLPTTQVFANVGAISIPDHGAAAPYPSTISVGTLTGLVSKVTVTLNGITHGFPDDLDVLLVGPTGRKVVLLSDAGGGHSISNVTLTLDDSTGGLPDSSTLVSGSGAPIDYEAGDAFPPPAPGGVAAVALSTFNGISPVGTWSLYVVDDATGDAGMIANGWNLSLTTINAVSPIGATLSAAVVTSGQLQFTLTGEPDQSYVIQASTNLTSWTSLSTNLTDGEGALRFTDPTAPTLLRRFYRAVRLTQ